MSVAPSTPASQPPARALVLSHETAALRDAVRSGGGPAEVAALREAINTRSPRLTVTVLSTYDVRAGGGVSYGHTFVAETDTRAADVALGYGHGLPRHAGNRAPMSVTTRAGEVLTIPIVGRVAMDDSVVLIDEVSITAGDVLTVFGDAPGELGIVEWCALIGEDPVSVVCALDDRVTVIIDTAKGRS